MLSVTFKHRHIYKLARRRHLALKPHLREIPAMTGIARFDKKLIMASRRIVEKSFQPLAAMRPEGVGTLPDQPAIKLWHARRRRASTRRERKDMEIGQARPVNQAKRGVMRCITLGRKAGNEVGPENDVRAAAARLVTEPDHIPRQMTPLHPLQDRIVTMLGLQMQMRH